MADEQSTADAQMQMALAALHQNIEVVINQGREDYGEETFDSLSKEFTDAIGRDALAPVISSIIETDAPARIIEHLAANPERAKALAGMSPARRAAELGRIEAQLLPTGLGGAEPAWRVRAREGNKPRMTDDASDEQFQRAWFQKYPNGFVPPRLGGPSSRR